MKNKIDNLKKRNLDVVQFYASYEYREALLNDNYEKLTQLEISQIKEFKENLFMTYNVSHLTMTYIEHDGTVEKCIVSDDTETYCGHFTLIIFQE